jgi:uroporphyrinogen-III synthase
VNKILISQPEPQTNSPYFDLAARHDLKVDFCPFIEVEGIPSKFFRKQKVNPQDYDVIILTSRTAADHLFRVCKEMRIQISQETRYICMTESIALYLQNYIQYRKRKVLYGKGRIKDMFPLFKKHKKKRFLFPCSENSKQDIPDYLKKQKIKFDTAPIYRTVSADITQEVGDVKAYDMIVFFSPSGIESLFKNFPDFEQKDTLIAAFGPTTHKAVEEAGLELNIQAPKPNAPSMTMAIEEYLKKSGVKKVSEQ